MTKYYDKIVFPAFCIDRFAISHCRRIVEDNHKVSSLESDTDDSKIIVIEYEDTIANLYSERRLASTSQINIETFVGYKDDVIWSSCEMLSELINIKKYEDCIVNPRFVAYRKSYDIIKDVVFSALLQMFYKWDDKQRYSVIAPKVLEYTMLSLPIMSDYYYHLIECKIIYSGSNNVSEELDPSLKKYILDFKTKYEKDKGVG